MQIDLIETIEALNDGQCAVLEFDTREVDFVTIDGVIGEMQFLYRMLCGGEADVFQSQQSNTNPDIQVVVLVKRAS